MNAYGDFNSGTGSAGGDFSGFWGLGPGGGGPDEWNQNDPYASGSSSMGPFGMGEDMWNSDTNDHSQQYFQFESQSFGGPNEQSNMGGPNGIQSQHFPISSNYNTNNNNYSNNTSYSSTPGYGPGFVEDGSSGVGAEASSPGWGAFPPSAAVGGSGFGPNVGPMGGSMGGPLGGEAHQYPSYNNQLTSMYGANNIGNFAGVSGSFTGGSYPSTTLIPYEPTAQGGYYGMVDGPEVEEFSGGFNDAIQQGVMFMGGVTGTAGVESNGATSAANGVGVGLNSGGGGAGRFGLMRDRKSVV